MSLTPFLRTLNNFVTQNTRNITKERPWRPWAVTAPCSVLSSSTPSNSFTTSYTPDFSQLQCYANLTFETASLSRNFGGCSDKLNLTGCSVMLNSFSRYSRTLQFSSVSPTGFISKPLRYLSTSTDDLASHALQPLETANDSSNVDVDFSRVEDKEDLIRATVEEVASALPMTERLFAVIQIDNKQYRVSQDDVLTVQEWLPTEMGDRIRLEKVLVVGGRDFSLFGRPLLKRSQVSVEATVIEKSLTATDLYRRFRQRSRFKKTWLRRKPITYLRINSVKLLDPR